MGLILYAVLIFFGLRGMPLKKAGVYCAVTALILTALGIGAMADPGCDGLGCTVSMTSVATVFLSTLAIALVCFGSGLVLRRLSRRSTRV